MRVVVHKVGGGEESGVLLYKDTLGVFIRIGRQIIWVCLFVDRIKMNIIDIDLLR